MSVKAPKGTKDILSAEVIKWQTIENKIREICSKFGYNEIRTPIFEHTEVFLRTVGEETDIVKKEMYTFLDKGNRSVTLRPEGTAPVARAFIEHKLYSNPKPTKLFYLNPTFRYENPQEGRQRQFHQFGVESFGSNFAAEDAQIISLAKTIFDSFGLKNLELHLNSLGCPDCMQDYNEALKKFIYDNYDNLCETCKTRAQTNPLRTLDCKEPRCSAIMSNAPWSIDYLDADCKKHFEDLREMLINLSIPFIINPQIVRGLDYYTKTVFEFVTREIDTQVTICGGGRYDNLIEQFDGPSTPAVGFGMGMERLIITLDNNGFFENNIDRPIDYFIGSIGEKGFLFAQNLVYKLRRSGYSAESDTMRRSVKAQMKYADKIMAKRAVIIGDDEIANNTISIKNMETGETQSTTITQLLKKLDIE